MVGGLRGGRKGPAETSRGTGVVAGKSMYLVQRYTYDNHESLPLFTSSSVEGAPRVLEPFVRGVGIGGGNRVDTSGRDAAKLPARRALRPQRQTPVTPRQPMPWSWVCLSALVVRGPKANWRSWSADKRPGLSIY